MPNLANLIYLHRKLPQYNSTPVHIKLLDPKGHNSRITADDWSGIIYRTTRNYVENLVPVSELYVPGILIKFAQNKVYINTNSGHKYGVIGRVFDADDETAPEDWSKLIILTATHPLLDDNDAEYLKVALLDRLRKLNKYKIINKQNPIIEFKIKLHQNPMLDDFLNDTFTIAKIADLKIL